MNIPFKFPVPLGYSDFPNWNGEFFVIGNKSLQVLEYSENFIGWSDDLTALHEDVVGERHPIDIASRNYALSQVEKNISTNNAVIMEIGCSSGYLLKALHQRFQGMTIIGADVVKEPLNRLAKDLPGVPLIRFDLLKCPLPAECVDVLVMLNVLEHIEDDVCALKNAFNLLKPGGVIIMEVPAGPFLYNEYDAELNHFRRYSAKELQQKLSIAGFSLVKQSHLGFILYPAFAIVKLMGKWLFARRRTFGVRNHAANTSTSLLVKLAMTFESNYLSSMRLPFGIRVLAVARRPKF